jgi:protein-S-isoprenylcysteine O-methyltransferase Ste14
VLVAVQVVLLVAVVVVPNADHWPTPAWVLAASSVLTVGGMIVVVVSVLWLGRSITPNPEPRASATLQTGGPFRWVRHPVYSGVLLLVTGVALRTGNVVAFVVAVVTVVFFHAKARWEEGRLAATYPEYAAYAARTPRFVPRLRRPRPRA